MTIKSYITLTVLLILCSAAADKTALQKQFIATETKISARIDEMVESDPTLKRRLNSLKDHQLHLSKLIDEHEEIKSIDGLKKSSPVQYLQEFNKRKNNLIEQDDEIRQAYRNIIDLQDQFSQIINQDKTIKELRLKLKIVKAQIHK